MFTGNIEVHCEDTSFTINATYWSDLEIDYSEVDTIEYRKDLDVGVRTNGFGSARLLMGIFRMTSLVLIPCTHIRVPKNLLY